MPLINLCLGLNLIEKDFTSEEEFESFYQKSIKPLLVFLYSHPKVCWNFAFTGIQLEWLQENHSESIQILGELTSRHQVEVLGGGYYAPVFPLLFPVDRSGQIEKLNAVLRSTIGKRPRGIALYGDIWDPSLVTTFQSCGMEYVFLNRTQVPSSSRIFLPIITSEQGKSLKIFPVNDDFVPASDEVCDLWLTRIFDEASKNNSGSEEKIVNIIFDSENIDNFFLSGIDNLLSDFMDTKWKNYFVFSTPQMYLKNCRHFLQMYIPAGMDWQIARWAREPYKVCENLSRFPLTIFDFLNTYPQNRRLYDRMMYISVIISQSKGGDKIRKRAAQEKLWESQSGSNYVSPGGIPAVMRKRQNAYRVINEAERYIRSSNDFVESLTSFDYNGDGLNEYICQMEKYHGVISLDGGRISELDLINKGSNSANSLTRIKRFDKFDDNYCRGIFVEHFIEESNLKDFLNSRSVENDTFANLQFAEKKFDARRKEIQLEGNGLFSSMNLPCSLLKNYIVSSDGFSVQYILKNQSPFSVKGIFIVEMNLAQTDFDSSESQYKTEIIFDGQKQEIVSDSLFTKPDGVSLIQVSDFKDKMLFLFEPNEEGGFMCSTVNFSRPNDCGEVEKCSSTQVISLYWNVDLAADRAVEKTINLSLIPFKKK